MNRFLKENEEWVLAAVGLLFMGLLVFFAIWTVTGISLQLSKAISAGDKDAGKIEFKIDTLKAMNLRGFGGPAAGATTSASSSGR